jgi:hypothetical protein
MAKRFKAPILVEFCSQVNPIVASLGLNLVPSLQNGFVALLLMESIANRLQLPTYIPTYIYQGIALLFLQRKFF